MWIKKLSLFLLTFLLFSFLFVSRAQAAVVTWDGGGADGTCGGGAGDGNKWSCGLNWSTDGIPQAADIATFNATSVKDCTVDGAININGIDINTNYSGTITQSAAVTLGAGDFNQADGTFAGSGDNIDINDGDFVLGAGAVFTSTSGILSVERNFTIDSSATWAHNSGTISIDGAGFTDNSTLACGSKTFSTVTFSKTAGGKTVVVGSDCSINLGNAPTTKGAVTNNGTLTVGTGTWTHNTGNLTLNSGSTTTFTGTKIDFNEFINSGDLTLNGGTLTANSMTTLDIDNGGLVLTSGTFNASSLSTLNVDKNLTNSSNLLPTGLDFTATGTSNGDDSTLTCSGNEAFNSFAITKSTSWAYTVIGSNCDLNLGNSPATGGTLTNNGTLTIGTGTWTHTYGTVTLNSGSTLTAGVTTINFPSTADTGDFILNGGTFTANSLTTMDIDNGDLTLTSGTFTAPSFSILKVDLDFTNSSNLLPTGIDYTATGSTNGDDSVITCSGNEAFNSIAINKSNDSATTKFASSCTTAGNFTVTDGPVLNSDSAYTLTVQGNFTMSTADAFGGSNLTVLLSGGNAQAMTANGGTFSSPLQINKSGNSASLSSTFATTTENCDVIEGIFDLDAQAFTCGGTFTIEDAATLKLVGSESPTSPTLDSGSTVSYKGNGDTNPDSYALKEWSYHHLTIDTTDSNDTITGNGIATINVAGNLALSDGILIGPTTLNVTGDWDASGGGTFTHNSGTVVLNGTGQEIKGATTFNNFTKSVSSADTLTWPASAKQTFVGTMALDGDAGQLLSLRSSSPNTQWEIDPQSTRTIEYLDVQDSNNVNATGITVVGFNITDSDRNTNWLFNNAPAATTPGSISQITDGTGYISFATTISDADSNDTKLKVEYSDDDGSTWYDPDLISATPSSGSVDLDDAQTYQIGTVDAIDSSGGGITLTIIWDTQSAVNGNGSLDNSDQNDIQVRVTPNDSVEDGAVATSASFSLDNLDPTTLASLAVGSFTATTLTLTWTAAVESNFSHYEVWYGTTQADVESRSGTASEWDNGDDSDLATLGTTTTTVTGLGPATYYFRLWAQDDYGNELNTSTVNQTLNQNPTSPSSLGPTNRVDGSWTSDTTPTLSFTLADPDTADTVKYQIQIDDSSDFSSVVVDYTSTLAAQGEFSFTVGQAAGSGSYTTGTAGQTLSDTSYYWRVRAIDNSDAASAYATANSGSIAFKVDNTSPSDFDLNSPDNDAFINSERPTFKWKTAANPDAGSALSSYQVEIDNGDEYDFTIDGIPSSRTETLETNRYNVVYEGFDDSDNTNNYISVYTKSSDQWSSSQNDGKLREGKRNWKVKAYDNAGNVREKSRDLFVDRSNPSLSFNIDDPGINYSSSVFYSTKTTFPISGTISDSKGGSNDDLSDKIRSDPDKVTVTVSQVGTPINTIIQTINFFDLTSDINNCSNGRDPNSADDTCTAFFNSTVLGLELGNEYEILIEGKDKTGNITTDTFALSIIITSSYYDQKTTPTPIPTDVELDGKITTISNVKAAIINVNSVTITWQTNHLATSKVNYGDSYDYGQDVQSTDKVTSHSQTITGLNPDTIYYYEVMSHGKTYAYDARHEFRTLGVNEKVVVPPEQMPTEPKQFFSALGRAIRSNPIAAAVGTTASTTTQAVAATAIGTIAVFALSSLIVNGQSLINTVKLAIGVGVSPTSLIDLLTSQLKRFLFNPFSILGLLRKRRKSLGIVFNALNNHPISRAFVLLYTKSGKLRASMSNRDGRFYINQLEPAKYQVKAEKQGYVFPSKLVTVPQNEAYTHIYQPEEKIDIKGEPALNLAIPMDPKVQKKNIIILGPLSKLKNILIYRLQANYYPILVLGLGISTYAYLADPRLLNLISSVSMLGTITLSLWKDKHKARNWGQVTNKETRKPLKGVEVILETKTKTKKGWEHYTSTTTDKKGYYLLFPENGKYRLTVKDKKGQTLSGKEVEVTKKKPTVGERIRVDL